MSELKKLLKDVSSINFKYEKLNDANSSKFNIFSILRNESEEVALHSRFIGELLNLKGSHEKNDHFQKAFIKLLAKNSENGHLLDDSFELFIERKMGKHGRIDLLLVGKNNVIIIENKIYADDQPEQLQRYSDAAKQFFPSKKANIFYLTLNGTNPSLKSLGKLTEDDVQCVSYCKDIKSWLEICAREVYNAPVIRETIVQYQRLIRKLTGQTMNNEQKMEIKELLLTEHNFEHALSIENVITDAKIEVQKKVWNELKTFLGDKFSYVTSIFEDTTVNICNDFYNTRNSSSCYGLQCEILKIEDYSIHLYLEVTHRFYYGFTVSKNGERGQYCTEFGEKYPEIENNLLQLNYFERKDSDWWIAWKYSDDKINFKNFNEGNTAKLANPAYRKGWVKAVTKDVVEVLDNVALIEDISCKLVTSI